jgi:DNA modification methylase
MNWTLHRGDCRDSMRGMVADSIDSIVTDPPYGLSFMGKGWDHGVPGVEFWTEALRVAKPGAHLLAFGGTRTFHRLTCAIEDAGWEIRDCIMWVYGSGFPKSLDVSKAIDREAGNIRPVIGTKSVIPGVAFEQLTPYATGRREIDLTSAASAASAAWEGWGTALKPAWEPIIVARKPLDGTVAANVQQYGTGAINVDGCRVGGEPSPSAAMRASGRVPSSCKPGEYGDTIQNRITPERWQERRPRKQLGRWPANVIHDGGEEVVGLMGDAARFFYCAKASKADRDEGCEKIENRPAGVGDERLNGTSEERRGRSAVQPRANIHPTVKPTALMRYLCRLVTPPGGTVLDPFAGSGSTGKAALLEGFNAILCELTDEYWPIIEARCNAVAKADRQQTLFD